MTGRSGSGDPLRRLPGSELGSDSYHCDRQSTGARLCHRIAGGGLPAEELRTASGPPIHEESNALDGRAYWKMPPM
jgi:hypothetical protein